MVVIRRTAEVLHERTREGKTFFDKFIGCWPNLYNARNGQTSVYPYKSRVMAVAGIRRNGAFHLPIGFTNAADNDSVPENMRLFVGRHRRFNASGNIKAAKQLAYRRGDDSSIIENTTTLFYAWGGPSIVSHFRIIPTSDGPAMRHVLKESEKITRDALDSITASNVAILVLPVSVIEYLSRSSLYITIIFTDIIPVLPLAITGVELLNFGRKSHSGCVANTVGTEKNRPVSSQFWNFGAQDVPWIQ